MVEWWMDDDDDDGFSTEIKPTLPYTAGVPSTYDHQPIRSVIAKVYILGTFRTKKTSDYRQGYSIPSYHVSDDDDDDNDLDWQGKAKQFISATNNSTHTFPASERRKIESWGVCRYWEGYVT